MNDISFDFEYLRQLVQNRSGIVLEPHKSYLPALYLKNLVAQAGLNSLKEFVEHLKHTPFNSLHIQTVEALAINETSFFRDRYPFETLRSKLLPFFMQSRSQQQPIHIWCAACSTGQEPYSIAILVHELFPDVASWKFRIIASDFSQCALDRAQQGQYSNLEVNRGLDSKLRDRYFQRTGSSWQLSAEIRKSVEFRQLNLIEAWDGLPLMDIIFLRNVLIYFDVETKRSILQKVQQHLQPDGFLFLGGGETTFQLSSRFEAVQDQGSLYHRLRSC
jgi:chemotaxis protein methyltransferase CheR